MDYVKVFLGDTNSFFVEGNSGAPISLCLYTPRTKCIKVLCVSGSIQPKLVLEENFLVVF